MAALFGKRRAIRAGINAATERAQQWDARLREEIEGWTAAGPVVRNLFRAASPGGAVAGVNILYLPSASYFRQEGWSPAEEETTVRRARWALVLAEIRVLVVPEESQAGSAASAFAHAEPGRPEGERPVVLWQEQVAGGRRRLPDGAPTSAIAEFDWFRALAAWVIAPLPPEGVRRDLLTPPELQATGQLAIGATVTFEDLADISAGRY
jgi:hypothetical protein